MSFSQDIPEDAEVVGEFGNTYLLDDGETTHYVTRTPAYELAYVHDYTELVFGGADSSSVVFDGPPKILVDATRSDRVFTLKIDDGRYVQNPPAERDRVLTALLEIAETGRSDMLTHLYEDLCTRQVDQSLLKRVQRRYSPIPPASVQITDEGWVIEDMFLLTWLGTVYLVTRNFDKQAYRLGGGVSRTDEDVEFIGLTPRGEPTPFDIPSEGETLEEREMLFLWKAYWLSSYRERHDDDLFWDMIEQHVQQTRARNQKHR